MIFIRYKVVEKKKEKKNLQLDLTKITNTNVSQIGINMLSLALKATL